MALIKCHECGHDVSTEASACPNCGAAPKTPQVAQKELPRSVRNAALGALALFIGAWVFVSATSSTKKTEASNTEPSASPSLPAQQTTSQPSYTTLREAIEGIRPRMSDEMDALSPGAKDLVRWAAKGMRWNELSALPGTSRALVMKDPESERGKKICFTGRIVEISVERDSVGSVTVGGMFDSQGGVYRFANAGSSGSLVEGSHASMCGVVVGRHDYSNSGGGTTHAVQLVGMFALPENMN